MAKGKSLLKLRGKKKAPRVTELAKREMDKKMYGETPPPITDRAKFLTWCNYVVDPNTAREWLDEYLEQSGRSTRGVPKDWINPSVCHRARLKTLGAPFTETQDRLLEEGIESILKHAVEVTDEEDEVDRPTIQDNIREKFHNIMGEVEGLIDDLIFHRTIDWNTFDSSMWFRERGISPKVASMIVDKLRPRMDGIETKSGYEIDECTVVNSLIEDLEKMIDNVKRSKPPRTPKPVSLEKKLKRLREVYLKYSKEWNVTSIDPSKIVGAKELWTLNVKYKLLTVFRTDGMGGQLDVKTCNVIGFSSDSQTYRLGRGKKQFTIVEEVLNASKAGLKKVVSELNKSDYLLERINENTVLLRVL